ncbi:MAG: nucleoside-diphosphate sugar epimerase/dehydratase [Candidatus Aminicenantes bacterium]|nr:nucleoside-diphosphate sugar epimerase/dehydratase [Candidatus Aminicenantes bacterium]
MNLTPIKKLLEPTKLKRTVFFLLLDILVITFAFYFSFYLRFGFTFPAKYLHRIGYWIPGVVLIKILALVVFDNYKINWRFVGLTELGNITKSLFISAIILYIGNFAASRYWVKYNLPRGVVVIDAILCFMLIGFLRISKRLYLEFFSKVDIGKRTLIIGADFTSERLVKELKNAKPQKLFPIAFVDENHMRIGTRINGISVLGGYEQINEIIKREKIDTVLINLPKDSHNKIGEIFNLISKSGVDDIKIVPQIDEFNANINVVKDIKNLDIDDLLSRESVKVDYEDIRNFLKDKTILVSGAAGSIGSEIVRKLVQFGVKHIIGYEIDETEIFNLEFELKKIMDPSQKVDMIVGDVRDRAKLARILESFRPDIIFHTSAYKHVPLMEGHPEEAVKTNVMGTLNLAEAAVRHGVKKFINISTDKAVNPTSIMGATKRLSEMVCKGLNRKETRFTSVRFGNVLGSRGSVIPLFLEQIKSGGPVTVTHPDIQRYFMSIPEAVLLVFQAAYMGDMGHKEGGEIFVLDMGEPVKIVSLAENLIRLNNMEPYRDIDIVFSGLRPGEKLFEELLTAEEGTDATTHSKIYIARNTSDIDPTALKQALKELEDALDSPGQIKGILKKYIPYYHETNE